MTSNENVIDSGLTLYDVNKMLIKESAPLDANERWELGKAIWQFCENTNNKFYMLLCNDIRYYTLFNRIKDAFENIEDIVMECAEDIGKIVSYNATEEAIEIWVRANEIEEILVMYFFPYDRGVVECL